MGLPQGVYFIIASDTIVLASHHAGRRWHTTQSYGSIIRLNHTQVAYDSIPADQRTALHGAVLAALEEDLYK